MNAYLRRELRIWGTAAVIVAVAYAMTVLALL